MDCSVLLTSFDIIRAILRFVARPMEQDCIAKYFVKGRNIMLLDHL